MIVESKAKLATVYPPRRASRGWACGSLRRWRVSEAISCMQRSLL